MPDWQHYATYRPETAHHVTGLVLVRSQVYSPQLKNRRDLLVYLPPSYRGTDRRYPVLYMHDGQNLFDAGTSYAGEWGVDETLEFLSQEGLEAIVVGLPNMGGLRMREYNPFHDARFQPGMGHQYLDFIADTVKPLIDGRFRTRPERGYTGLMGSSLGGLISLYGFFYRPETFGLVGAMSPSFWFAHGAIFDYVSHQPHRPGRIYLDAGTRESSSPFSKFTFHARSRRFYGQVRRMYRRLVQKGYRPLHEVRYVEEKLAPHQEAAWARRLPAALRFLLAAPVADLATTTDLSPEAAAATPNANAAPDPAAAPALDPTRR